MLPPHTDATALGPLTILKLTGLCIIGAGSIAAVLSSELGPLSQS